MNESTRTHVRRGIASVLLTALAAALLATGCALERADPAARSNRTTYGAISLVASGDGATVSLTIGDGTIASADGEGAITQPSTLTTEQSPDVTVPGDAVSAIASGVAHLGGKAIDAYTASAQNSKDCADGVCSEGACSEGVCSEGACSDCSPAN